MAETIYLLLGSNEGDRLDQLQSAARMLEVRLGSSQFVASSVYETAAWGLEDQPSFLNMALKLDTELSPEALLAGIQEIELAFGRQRTTVWGQRTLDVDIIFYGNTVLRAPDLSIPHPQLAARRFALVPLAELAPRLRHPVTDLSIEEMLRRCEDPLPVSLYVGE